MGTTPQREPEDTKKDGGNGGKEQTARRLSANDKSRAIALRLKKGLTYQEIADILKTSKQTIHRNLIELIPDTTTEIYRDHRADILSHTQLRLLNNVTNAKLKKASVRDLVVSAGILYDKERLERDLSTANVVSIVADLEALREARNE